MLRDKKDQIVYRWLFEQDEKQSERKGVVQQDEGEPIPGDAAPDKQAHIFDFDDTLGVTSDSNGIMMYKDGSPVWKTAQEAQAWVTQNGLQKELLKGPKGSSIEQPDGVEGFAVYVNSAGLTKARKLADINLIAPDKPAPGNQEQAGKLVLVADYSPSSTAKNAEPIDSTLNRVKNAPPGAETQIITARSGESAIKSGERSNPKDFGGKEHPPSVETDLAKFMSDQGITLSTKAGQPVKGMGGGNKGKQIKKTYFDARKPEEQPDEIHFYDDDPKNIDDVRAALKDVDAEVFLYGPGGFADPSKHPHPAGTASADTPKEKYPPSGAKKKKEEQAAQPLAESLGFDLDRWQRMAGIKRRIL